jgi:chlorophyllide a reductase subunit Y
MKEFFAGVGEGFAAGIWEETPEDRPEFRERYKRLIERQAKARKAEEEPV